MKPSIWTSRRFWVVIGDFVVACAGFIAAHFISDPLTVELLKFLVVALQPIAGVLVAAYTTTDVAYIQSQKQ